MTEYNWGLAQWGWRLIGCCQWGDRYTWSSIAGSVTQERVLARSLQNAWYPPWGGRRVGCTPWSRQPIPNALCVLLKTRDMLVRPFIAPICSCYIYMGLYFIRFQKYWQKKQLTEAEVTGAETEITHATQDCQYCQLRFSCAIRKSNPVKVHGKSRNMTIQGKGG